MTKGKVGRPPASEGSQGTRQIRVFADIADMIADILEVEPSLTTATLIDPLIRAAIVVRHQSGRDAREQLRKLAKQREQIINMHHIKKQKP